MPVKSANFALNARLLMIGNLPCFVVIVASMSATIALADVNTDDEFAPVADLLKSCEVCHGHQGGIDSTAISNIGRAGILLSLRSAQRF